MIDLFGRRRIARLTRELDDAKREIRRKDGIIERNCDLIEMLRQELAEKIQEAERIKFTEREELARTYVSKIMGSVSTRHIADAFEFADKWIEARGSEKTIASEKTVTNASIFERNAETLIDPSAVPECLAKLWRETSKPNGCRECNFNPGTIACLESRRDFDCNFDKRRAAK